MPGWEERNAVVRHVGEFGLDGWKADVDYGRRSLVENGSIPTKVPEAPSTAYSETCHIYLHLKIIQS